MEITTLLGSIREEHTGENTAPEIGETNTESLGLAEQMLTGGKCHQCLGRKIQTVIDNCWRPSRNNIELKTLEGPSHGGGLKYCNIYLQELKKIST